MEITNMDKAPKQSAAAPLFTGSDVQRTLLGTSKDFNFSVVHFGKGIRNKFHTHESDQILIVTKGRGVVATEKEERAVGPGDVIVFPAGEKHWHGSKDAAFSHIAITRQGSKTAQLEP